MLNTEEVPIREVVMHKELAAYALKEAMSAHRAFTRWLTWCHGLHAAKVAAGLYEMDPYDLELGISIEETYAAANKRPPMPSKTRKYRMYEAINRAARLADLDPGRISTMEDVAAMAEKVTAALARA